MDDEINLLDYIRVINKRKGLIIAFVIIASAIAFINTMRVPKMYKAEVTLLSMGSGVGGLAQSLSSLGLGVGGQGEGTNVDAILKSRALAKSIVEERNDLKQIIFKKRWDENNKLWIGKEPTLDKTAGALQSGLKSGDTKKIEAEWNDPQIAAEIANAYAKGLIKFLNQKAIGINLSVLDEAVPPTAPYNKKISLNIVIGGIIGLFLGAFLVFLLEYWDKSVGQQI